MNLSEEENSPREEIKETSKESPHPKKNLDIKFLNKKRIRYKVT